MLQCSVSQDFLDVYLFRNFSYQKGDCKNSWPHSFNVEFCNLVMSLYIIESDLGHRKGQTERQWEVLANCAA